MVSEWMLFILPYFSFRFYFCSRLVDQLLFNLLDFVDFPHIRVTVEIFHTNPRTSVISSSNNNSGRKWTPLTAVCQQCPRRITRYSAIVLAGTIKFETELSAKTHCGKALRSSSITFSVMNIKMPFFFLTLLCVEKARSIQFLLLCVWIFHYPYRGRSFR